MGILRMLGLMRVSNHLLSVEMERSLGRAASQTINALQDALAAANAEIAALRPDAELTRARRERDKAYSERKRGKSQALVASPDTIAKVKTGLAKRAAKKGAA